MLLLAAACANSSGASSPGDDGRDSGSAARQHKSSEAPPREFDGSRAPGLAYNTLGELVSASDIIVVGRFASTSIGNSTSLDDPDEELRWRDVSLIVEQQLYGPPLNGKVTVQQVGYLGDMGMEEPDMPWLYPGDRVICFGATYENAPPGHYKILLAGQWVIQGETLEIQIDDPVVLRFRGVTPSVAVNSIREAVRK